MFRDVVSLGKTPDEVARPTRHEISTNWQREYLIRPLLKRNGGPKLGCLRLGESASRKQLDETVAEAVLNSLSPDAAQCRGVT
ncbi:MAG TPA: hypothetical protein VFB78_11265 [Acidimicrobiales bacterium]|nr:hypothetical protein [Acidimicrobiales bacterium]